LNNAYLHDPFLTPFTDEVLENVGGQEAYSFTGEFFGYHQINIAPEDRHKTTFATEWGSYQYTVMSFGLKNALVVFIEVYLDYWNVFSLLKYHIETLCLILDRRRQY
jgi:hypothetical protein